jgi:4-hydroxy-tetrahydrodipicolinate synthase
LIAHYTTIADAVSIPLILYNVPGRTAVNIAPDTVATLSEHKNIIAIKEASGDIGQIAKIARLCPNTFGIYSGNDDQIIPVLSLGGIGVISVVANILPKETHDMVSLYLNGQNQDALALQLKLLNFINALFIEVNPIPVKTAMNLMGTAAGDLRLPLTAMEEQSKQVLVKEMRVLGLLPINH